MKTRELKRKIKNTLVIPLLARAPSRHQIVHMLHVAKTGGTAIQAALPLDEGLNRMVTPSHAIYFRNHEVWLRHIPRGQKVVFGVRDPAKRFVSAFYSRRASGPTRRPPRDYEKAAYHNFETPRELAAALSSTDPARKAQAEDAMRAILHTRIHLADWVGTAARLAERADDVLYVYRQETLAHDFGVMQCLLRIPPTDLPRGEKANRLRDEVDTGLDAIGADNIRAWYAEDYRVIEACERLFATDARMSRLPEA